MAMEQRQKRLSNLAANSPKMRQERNKLSFEGVLETPHAEVRVRFDRHRTFAAAEVVPLMSAVAHRAHRFEVHELCAARNCPVDVRARARSEHRARRAQGID